MRPGADRGEVVEVVVAEAEGLEVAEHLLQPRNHQEPPLRWQRSHEQLEGGQPIHARLAVGGGHRQLVEIGEERGAGGWFGHSR